LFAIGFRCIKNTKHQYLAFDVSLPPPNYLSCSPKQLDSDSKLNHHLHTGVPAQACQYGKQVLFGTEETIT